MEDFLTKTSFYGVVCSMNWFYFEVHGEVFTVHSSFSVSMCSFIAVVTDLE